MDGTVLARLAAIVFVAVALTATAIEMTGREEAPASPIARAPESTASDPLQAGQRRCQRLGEAGPRDAECLRVWAESRDRFLGRTTQPDPTAPAAQAGPSPEAR
jgi:conjugative transfer region protein TrbK